MKLEHVALNVADPVAVAAWYCAHLGMSVARHIPQPAQTHFLHDGAGSIVEIYRNPPDQVPDYAAMDPLIVHLAFTAADAAAERAAGGGGRDLRHRGAAAGRLAAGHAARSVGAGFANLPADDAVASARVSAGRGRVSRPVS